MRPSVGAAAGALMVLMSTAQADVLSMPPGLTSLELVPVGNPGNAVDTEVMTDGTTGYGSVAEPYQIGKYEVTAAQYTVFLNAVAATDPYGLYSTQMWSDGGGCKIERSGSPGSYTYSVAADWANRPVNYVSWGDAARFANWLHNGQPTGAQDLTTTEDGAYFLNGANNDTSLRPVTRKSDATWFIPTEDEWYKAAYHKNDGVTGNYFDYPTASDNVPRNDLIDPDPGNNANFSQSSGLHGLHEYTIGSPYNRTEVGEFENSESPYGTFDQGGNVWEWNDTHVWAGQGRGMRGGAWWLGAVNYLHARARGFNNVMVDFPNTGFRVARIPEPGSMTLLLCGLVAGLIWWRRRR